MKELQPARQLILVVRTEAMEGDVGIFLSYRRADSELVVGPIYDQLILHFSKEKRGRELCRCVFSRLPRLCERLFVWT